LVDFQTKHPLFSVSVARLISFVRTLMPIAAGASGLSYRRFVPYEVLGLVGWTVLYVSIGVVGRESWMATVRWVGVGGAFVFVVVAMVLWSAGMRVGWGGRPAEGGGDV
jgi:membrane-associated protein